MERRALLQRNSLSEEQRQKKRGTGKEEEKREKAVTTSGKVYLGPMTRVMFIFAFYLNKIK